jgi:hypothetical protein
LTIAIDPQRSKAFAMKLHNRGFSAPADMAEAALAPVLRVEFVEASRRAAGARQPSQ